ncbi:MAG: SLBB domain-containing protein [Deferrisomatales bacterium]|nr:SLBB domain-containing protein [Deferrisomatales bacterium]
MTVRATRCFLFLLFLGALCAPPARAAGPTLPGGLSPAALMGMGLPAGVDVEALIEQYRQSQGGNPAGAIPTTPVAGEQRAADQLAVSPVSPVSPVDPEATLRQEAERLLWNGRINQAQRETLERLGETFGLPAGASRRLVDQVLKRQAKIVSGVTADMEALLVDGVLDYAERQFLLKRTGDRGLAAEAAERLVDWAEERVRKRGTYRSLVEVFLKDGAIDPGEAALLTLKEEELGLAREDYDEVSQAARDALQVPGGDLLGEIQARDRTLQPLLDELQLYGQGQFGTPPGAFTPATPMAPPESYVVGPGDVFQLNLWGPVEDEHTLVVDADGRALVPKIGPVPVGGLTYAEARTALRRKAEAITGVSATAILAALRPVQVLVVGEVMKPGAATLPPFSTTVHALMAAAGPSDIGSLRGIIVRRGGAILAELDLYQFLHEGQVEGDQILHTGDVVVVPKARRLVELRGEVRKPAIYELLDGEGLRALLGYAGGLAPGANGGRVQVDRSVSHEHRVEVDISLKELEADLPLRDGDRIRVFPLPPEVSNEVALFGHLHQPGKYAWTEGMRLSDLVGVPGVLKPDVDLTYAVIVRKSGAERSKRIHPFQLEAALRSPGSDADLLLQPLDEVYIFPGDQFRAPFRAKATGEVRAPGWHRILPGARVAELVRLAGGVTPEGLTTRAELIRQVEEGSRVTLYVDLAQALGGDPVQNLELLDGDELVVSPVTAAYPETFALIAGEIQGVARPGDNAGATVPERLDAGLEGAATTREALRIPLTRSMRIHDLVFKAGGLTKDAYLPVAHLYRTDPETRNVTIHTFDLGKALGGDPEADLELADRDHVVIHSADEFHPVRPVVVAGMVTAPGQYPFAENIRVRDLVLAAGGLREAAYLAEAEIVRAEVVGGGEKVETRTIPLDLGKAMAGAPTDNLLLEPYDKLLVKQIPEWRETWSIEIAGEVRFPGMYYVAKGEHLSSVLQRAGGYSSSAYLRGGVFARESARLRQQQRLDELRERLQQTLLRAASADVMASINPGDVGAMQQYLTAQRELLQKLKEARATGRVVVKLLPLEDLKGSTWDVTLENGDKLTVPKTPQTVDVVGSVYNPTSLLWESQKPKVEHYLYKTGGPTRDAEDGEIYVVRSDGTVVSGRSLSDGSWWSRGIQDLDLFPGDTVLVPEKVIRAPYMRQLRDITQILYQIAITAGVAITLF